MFARLFRSYKTFTPAVIGANETKALFPVKAGWRVQSVSVHVLSVVDGDSTSTIAVGDGDSAGRFVATTDGDLEAAAIYDGSGTKGYLYTADDTVDLAYTAGTPGDDAVKVRVAMTYTKDEG